MSDSIKICHLTSAHPDGDVRIFHKECVSLYNFGYNVSLIIPNTTSRVEKGVKIISFESNYKSRRERMTKTVNQVLEHALKLNADIYHIHDPELLKIVKPLKRKGKKVVYDVHEDLPRQILSKHWIPGILRKLISITTEVYENRISKKCDYIITATPFIKNRFLKVNPNTIDVNNFPIIEELLIDYDYKLKTEKSVCYVGGITKTRGIIEIIKSINGSDITLLLAGKFLEENLKEQASKIDGWKNVKELGFLTRDQVIDVYKESKVGLVTLHPIINYIDALPVKMFEYMAAGLPVIASNFPLWQSIVEKNNCGICVNPLKPDDINKAIQYLIDNPSIAEEMGNKGKELVKAKYNWKNEEQKLIDVYKKLS